MKTLLKIALIAGGAYVLYRALRPRASGPATGLILTPEGSEVNNFSRIREQLEAKRIALIASGVHPVIAKTQIDIEYAHRTGMSAEDFANR